MTFPPGVVEIRKCSDEELKTMLDEAREASKHLRKLGRVMGIVAAHRLQQMKDLLVLDKLSTWRRMNGFDRVTDGEDNWFHGPRLLPSTPEELAADLWSKVNVLKNAISMPAKTRPWQQTIEFVDGLKGKLPDEELAVIKRYVEKRSREAAQAKVTVTPVDTVQYFSPNPQTPEPSPDVCVKLENNEGRIDPERGELEPPSAGTGLETPGQQCPPNEGSWEKGRIIADSYLFVGMGSTTTADISSPMEHVGTQAGTAATPAKRRHKTTSEENKQFDPGGKGEKAPLWTAAVISIFLFSGESVGPWGARCLCFVFFCLCIVFFSCLLCSTIIVPFS